MVNSPRSILQGQFSKANTDFRRPPRFRTRCRQPYRRDEWHGIISGIDHHDQRGAIYARVHYVVWFGPHTPHGISRFVVPCRPDRYVDRSAKSTPQPPRTRTTCDGSQNGSAVVAGSVHRNGWSVSAQGLLVATRAKEIMVILVPEFHTEPQQDGRKRKKMERGMRGKLLLFIVYVCWQSMELPSSLAKSRRPLYTHDVHGIVLVRDPPWYAPGRLLCGRGKPPGTGVCSALAFSPGQAADTVPLSTST
jgi:hypothetical protein